MDTFFDSFSQRVDTFRSVSCLPAGNIAGKLFLQRDPEICDSSLGRAAPIRHRRLEYQLVPRGRKLLPKRSRLPANDSGWRDGQKHG